MIKMQVQDRKLELELAQFNTQSSSGVGQIPKLPQVCGDRDNMDAEAKASSRDK